MGRSLMVPLLSYPLRVGLVVYSLVRGSRGRMNSFGRRAMTHWREFCPEAYSGLEDPVAFFTQMGQEIATQIAELTPQLEGTDQPGEGYLEKVARLNAARAQATELVIAESGMYATAELIREDWEGWTQEHETGLVDWANRMQEQLDGFEWGLSFEDTADRYLLTVDFLERMTSSSSPLRFLDDPANRSVWLASVEARWERDKHLPQT